MPALRPGVLAIGLALSSLAATGCASRDAIPETRDVHQTASPSPSDDAYVHLARRPLAVIGLAEARGMTNDIAGRAVDHLADALDSCATDLGRQGKLVDGTARIVAMIGADGAVSGLNVKLAPGAAVAANALLCLVTPLKLTTFDPADGADGGAGVQRGFAIEASWGPHVAGAAPGAPEKP
jgi:hypothetical protein